MNVSSGNVPIEGACAKFATVLNGIERESEGFRRTRARLPINLTG